MSQPTTVRRRRRAFAAAAGFTVIFCAHYLVAKELLRTVDVMALAAARGVGGGVLLAVLFRRQLAAMSVRAVALSAVVGVFGFCLNQVLFLHGLARSTPADAAVLSNLIPIASTVAAVAMGLELATRRKAAGLALGFASVAAYLLWQTGAAPWEHTFGNLLIVANVASLAVALALAKRFAHETSGPAMTAWMLLTGGVVLTAVSLRELGTVWTAAVASVGNAAMIGFEVVVSTAVAYALNIHALRVLPVSTTMVFAHFQPIVTGLLVFAVYGQVPSLALVPLLAAIVIATFAVVDR